MTPVRKLTVSFRNRTVGTLAPAPDGTAHPHLADLLAVGAKIKLPESRCRAIVDEVRSACAPLPLL